MDALELKAEFGDRLAFMGGVDTQGLLPFATAAEVRRATERLLEGMTAGGNGRGPGGYILAGSHTIPPDAGQEHLCNVRDGRDHAAGDHGPGRRYPRRVYRPDSC